MELWGVCGDVEIAGQIAGVAPIDDCGVYRLVQHPELRISEFDDHLCMANDGCLCVHRRTRSGRALLPLSGTGLFARYDFYRLGQSQIISRPTPEIEACIERREKGRATKGEVSSASARPPKS